MVMMMTKDRKMSVMTTMMMVKMHLESKKENIQIRIHTHIY